LSQALDTVTSVTINDAVDKCLDRVTVLCTDSATIYGVTRHNAALALSRSTWRRVFAYANKPFMANMSTPVTSLEAMNVLFSWCGPTVSGSLSWLT